ncbi:MAG: OmpA family protein, partial [Alphaproteobacteria bacterium]|nr:OmpA family protein [Alphaproteobacteria bacterium]
ATETFAGALEILAPPPPLNSPTILRYAGEGVPGALLGTWDEGSATILSVIIPAGDIAATLGKDDALQSDGTGHWTLALSQDLAPGRYDVTVTTSDDADRVAAETFAGALDIKAPPPPPPPPLPPLKAPTIASYSGIGAPRAMLGTWDEGNATTLNVAVPAAGITAALGLDDVLKSDGSGHWILALPQDLAPGRYDVTVTTGDGADRVAAETFVGALDIKAPPPPPPPLRAPTIASYDGIGVPRALLGTWDEGNATTLNVAVPAAGITAALGMDEALKSDGSGHWILALPQDLAPGRYDVAVTTSDGADRVAAETFAGALDIKAPPPPPPPLPPLKAPTIASYDGIGVPVALQGTWDEGNATTLNVAVPGVGIAAALGTDDVLKSDGSGHWSLELPKVMAPGRYDVTVTMGDGADRVAAETFVGALEIKAPPPPPPLPPYDCAGVLNKVSETFPIRFAFDRTTLESPYDLSVKQAAAVLTDPRCSKFNARIEGHADRLGGRLYNEALAIARAQTVYDHLVAAGVGPARLSIAGKGKRYPIVTADSAEARSVNRRAVITIVE